MDSMDLEREKGITILAKNTAVRHGGTTINIIDTPGHADFGGEVERGLSMVDGVLLLVDASEGPLPQTRFVLRKALQQAAAGRPRHQQGRPPRRPHRRGRRRDLRAVPRPRRRRAPDRLPDRLRQRQGRPGVAEPPGRRRACPDSPDLEPLFDTIMNTVPAPVVRPRARRCRRTSPTSTPRPTSAGSRCAASTTATMKKGQRSPGARPTAPSSGSSSPSCSAPRRSSGSPIDEAGPGDIVAIAGIPEITIGETLADPDDPRPLPVITDRRAEPSR